MAGPLPDDRTRDCHHLGIEVALNVAEFWCPNIACSPQCDPGGGGALVSIRAGIVGEELRCRWRRALLPFTPIGQSVLGHIDRRWLPHLVQANGFRACRRR